MKEWPRAKVGEKMAEKWRDMVWKLVAGEKKLARKEYSAVALSMRARLKWRNGISR